MIGGVGVAVRNEIDAFRGLAVAFEVLLADRVAAKVNIVGFQYLAVVQQVHLCLLYTSRCV